MDTIKRRLESLERSNRRLQWALAISIVLAIAGSATARPKDRVLNVEEIVVRDSAGRARLIIGTPRVAGTAVSLPADDAAIWISDQNGNDRLIVTADGIRFANAKQRPSVDISAGALGATIHLYDSGNRLVWSAP
jgi:hypothetical protein